MENNVINGWVFVNKPKGDSSTLIVSKIKKHLRSQGIKSKVGHGGTLDPMAEGLLPIAIGEATKTVQFVMDCHKVYEFGIHFGKFTDTYDEEGNVIRETNVFPSKKALEEALVNFQGNISQKPPAFSAVKINGNRAYKLAREGKEVEIKPRNVFIKSIDLLEFDESNHTALLRAEVGKGTYIRSLAVDIAESLGSLGYVYLLKRTNYVLKNLNHILHLDANNAYNLTSYLYSIEDLLNDILAYPLNEDEYALLLNGNLSNIYPNTNMEEGSIVKAVYKNKVIALLKVENKRFSFIRLFNY